MAKLIYKDPFVKVPQPKSLIVYLPKEFRPFQYKKERIRRLDNSKFVPEANTKEVLTGFVHGRRASDLEERFAKALDFYGLDFIFQYEVATAYSLPNEGKKIDFIVFDGGLGIPIEIGASFVHDSPSKLEEERERQGLINPVLMAQGILPLGLEEYKVEFDRPKDFEDAKILARELFRNA
jgi:hypothetical protein